MKQLIYQFDIAGTTRTLDFGMSCWEMFCEKMDVAPSDILSVFQGGKTFRSMRMVAYCGIAAHDYLEGKPSTVTEQEVAKWLNANPQVMESIFAAALGTFYGVDTSAVKAETEPASKKKASRSAKSKK